MQLAGKAKVIERALEHALVGSHVSAEADNPNAIDEFFLVRLVFVSLEDFALWEIGGRCHDGRLMAVFQPNLGVGMCPDGDGGYFRREPIGEYKNVHGRVLSGLAQWCGRRTGAQRLLSLLGRVR
jgi:hypothetical protein